MEKENSFCVASCFLFLFLCQIVFDEISSPDIGHHFQLNEMKTKLVVAVKCIFIADDQ